MSPGKAIGPALGILILASVFGLPVGINGDSTMFSTFLSQVGKEQTSQVLDPMLVGAEFVMLLGVALVIGGGFLGYFPMASGVMALFGVVLFAAGEYLIKGVFTVSISPLGFMIQLGCSVGLILASQWKGRPSAYF
jgi:hypothetical protein